MDFTSLLIGIIFGGIIGAVIIYFVVKSSHIPRQTFDDLNHHFIRATADLENADLKNNETIEVIAGLNSELKDSLIERQKLNELQ